MVDAPRGSSAQDVDVAAAGVGAGSDDRNAEASNPDLANLAAGQLGLDALSPTAIQNTPAGDAAPTTHDPSATIANLSAQIAQKAGGQTTRFDVQLDPVGLGRVNVSVEIDAGGAMSAALSFEKPEAASLLRAHASDLQQSLAQAGFNLSSSALSFSTAAQDGRGAASQAASLGTGANGGGQHFQNGESPNGQSQNGQGQDGQAHNAGRAFGAAGVAADQADQVTTAAAARTPRGRAIRGLRVTAG